MTRHPADPGSNSALPIGIFDSGLGGLTVWRQLRQQLPHESLVYFGDTARLPYGSRSRAEIEQFVREIMAWMLAQPVKMIVMACNTSSALALETVRPDCPVPMLGIILPGAKAAVECGSRIGVLATPATANSHAYQQAIQESSTALGEREVTCWEQSCPEFVPLIESGQLHSPRLRQVAWDYLQPLLSNQIDTLVYGCTHYPLIESVLKPLLPASVQLVDPALALVEAISRELDLWGIRNNTSRPGKASFAVSGDPQQFANLATQWLDHRTTVAQVQLQPSDPSLWACS